MTVDDRICASDTSRDQMAFELDVLQDAQRQADCYWSNWLWCRTQPQFGPTQELLDRLSARYGRYAVDTEWRRWFAVLTSWEYVDAMMGRDVRRLLDDYDHCR